MSVNKNYSVHFYFILWCLYYLQGTLYREGSFISQGILLLVLFVSIAHFVRSHNLGIPRTLKYVDFFLVMIIVYGFIGFINGYIINVRGMTVMDYVKGVLVSFLPIYSFYYYSRRGEVTEHHLNIWTIVLLVVYSLSFIYKGTGDNSPINIVGNIEEGTNNAGYLLVSLIPLLFFLSKKPVIQYMALAIIVFFALTSVKRGAIILGLIMSIVIVATSLKNRTIWQKTLIVFLFVGIVYIGYSYVLYLISSSDYVNFRIQMTESGNSSDRDRIYKYFFNSFINQTNPGKFLFGSGAFATMRMFGIAAHNDWLELAINQGMFGLIVYLMYWISLIKDWRKCHDDKIVFMAMGLTSMFLLFRTFVSMSYSMIPLSCSLMLGYGLATSVKNSNYRITK